MKTFLSIPAALALLAVPASIFATGDLQPVPPQGGSITFTTNTLTSLNTWAITNSFPYAFPVTPVLQFFPQTTNAAPYTNLFVTLTNFAVEISSNNSTFVNGGQLNWTAQIPNPRLEYGTFVVNSGAGATNYVFPTPYAQFCSLPQVFITSQAGNFSTNAQISVVAVTYTNFSVSAGAVTQTNQWMSIGPAVNAGPVGPVTY